MKTVQEIEQEVLEQQQQERREEEERSRRAQEYAAKWIERNLPGVVEKHLEKIEKQVAYQARRFAESSWYQKREIQYRIERESQLTYEAVDKAIVEALTSNGFKVETGFDMSSQCSYEQGDGLGFSTTYTTFNISWGE